MTAKYLTGEERDRVAAEAARLYTEDGLSIREVAERIGRSQTGARNLLEHARVTFRSKGRNR
ncbi:helix-turn-helix domain-containing protein [Streptomyces chilikensis]|uniref:Helix-turn-helix domain-containing protein n=1 Tax=Streptomyces chilikensis TaxID=1194079 RepID=A0ABV3EJ86_9ACTN